LAALHFIQIDRIPAGHEESRKSVFKTVGDECVGGYGAERVPSEAERR